MSNILITASIGLIRIKDKFYIQVISADNENHYFLAISSDAAETISNDENLEIELMNKLP
jgi:hypothetical protein